MNPNQATITVIPNRLSAAIAKYSYLSNVLMSVGGFTRLVLFGMVVGLGCCNCCPIKKYTPPPVKYSLSDCQG